MMRMSMRRGWLPWLLRLTDSVPKYSPAMSRRTKTVLSIYDLEKRCKSRARICEIVTCSECGAQYRRVKIKTERLRRSTRPKSQHSYTTYRSRSHDASSQLIEGFSSTNDSIKFANQNCSKSKNLQDHLKELAALSTYIDIHLFDITQSASPEKESLRDGVIAKIVRIMSLVRPRDGNRSSNGTSAVPNPPPVGSLQSSTRSTFFTIRIDPIRDTVDWLRGINTTTTTITHQPNPTTSVVMMNAVLRWRRTNSDNSSASAIRSIFRLSDYTDRLSVLTVIRKTRRKEPSIPCASASVQTNSHDHLYTNEAYQTFVNGIRHTELDPLCQLPEGMNYREWMATNVGSFFCNINVLYAPCREFCVADTCPFLSGYDSSCVNWIDERGKKNKVSGIQYMDLAMEYVDRTLHDETLFPRLPDYSIPSSLDQTLRKMMRLLFQILCHLYDKHFEQMMIWKIWPHLNSVFLHLLTFGIHFKLMDTPKDTDVLGGLYWTLLKVHKKQLATQSQPSLSSDDS